MVLLYTSTPCYCSTLAVIVGVGVSLCVCVSGREYITSESMWNMHAQTLP